MLLEGFEVVRIKHYSKLIDTHVKIPVNMQNYLCRKAKENSINVSEYLRKLIAIDMYRDEHGIK